MGVKYTGTAVFKSGLEIQGKFPLDSRTVIENAEDLLNYKSLFTFGGVGSWYPGMTVVALDTKKLYVLASEEEGFVEAGGSVDPSDLVGVFTYKGTVDTYENLP
jgi:DNA-binding beta-propeller fold protein YncE